MKLPNWFVCLGEALPTIVKKWAGISHCLGMFEGVYLADLNDDGKNFSTIADLIEKNVENL
jgi:hypothetical protein